MKVISTKLKVTDAFTEEEFFATLIKWLEKVGPCSELAKKLTEEKNKINVELEAKYCKMRTSRIEKDDVKFTLFKLQRKYYEQDWTFEVILKSGQTDKVVYFHIDCAGDATRFGEAPKMHTDVIREFVNSGYVKQTSRARITAQPIEATDDMLDWIASAINGDYTDELPLILASPIFGTMATSINAEEVAEKLAGIAYVVVCDDEYPYALKSKAGKSAPYDGAVEIYCKNGKPRRCLKDQVTDNTIIKEIQRVVTAVVDAEAPTWKDLHAEQDRKNAEANSEFASGVIEENETLETKLKKAEEKIEELKKDNINLTAKNESLQKALAASDVTRTLIETSDVEEFFEGEHHDLIVTVLQKALNNCDKKELRKKELLTGLLEKNKIIGNGKKILEVIKDTFANGEEINMKTEADLKSIGFEVTDDNKHYKITFKGSEQYWFPVAKTTSDKKRSGKNLASDICKTISVYK